MDIVENLRQWRTVWDERLASGAADEIERLRREVAEFRALHPVTQVDEDAVNARLDVVAAAANTAIERELLK